MNKIQKKVMFVKETVKAQISTITQNMELMQFEKMDLKDIRQYRLLKEIRDNLTNIL